MPTYQYACTECAEQLEAVQKFTDDPLTICPVCQGRLRKLFSSVGIVFKGSGFYRTDSRSSSGEPAVPAGDSGKGDSGTGDSGKGDSSKGEKPAAAASSDGSGSSTPAPAPAGASTPAPSSSSSGSSGSPAAASTPKAAAS